MSNPLEIPEEELQVFQSFLHIYSKGKTIVSEGEKGDQKIFLLRQGEVEVFKRVGEQQQSLGNIKAVNFFGEMAIVSRRPRTATIIASTDPVVLYEFDNPNLSAILGNHKWGALLIKRLADDLEERHTEYEQERMELKRLRTEISDMVGALVNLYAVAGQDEYSKQMFLDALPKILEVHTSGMGIKLRLPDESRLRQYKRLGIITEQLYRSAIITRAKLKGES